MVVKKCAEYKIKCTYKTEQIVLEFCIIKLLIKESGGKHMIVSELKLYNFRRFKSVDGIQACKSLFIKD